ncbi:MAG: DedA family protein [Egibacteraceae bacterium]
MIGKRLTWVAAPLVLLSLMGIAAAAFTPVLIREHPLLLLVLESRNRYLLLASPRTGWVAFTVVGVLRRLASDPFFYLLGRWYGDRALRWLEEQSGSTGTVRWVQRWFAKVADLAVLLFPGALVCVLAGTAGMRWRRFLALNVAGSVLAVVALRILAVRASGVLTRIIAFNDRNATLLTAFTLTLTAVWLLARRRRGRRALPDVSALEDPPEHD